MTLEELMDQCRDCQLCGLAEGRTNLVFGEGDPEAKMMFIGEGPGADEDRLGRPFVGAAGKLLERMLAAIQLTREQVYIANIVKCRPPHNRVPAKDEAQACLPYLYRQIRIIAPKIIVLLGSTALQHLISPEARITRMRGQWLVSKSGIKIMPTYHPAALLRDPAKKRESWADFKQIREAYRTF